MRDNCLLFMKTKPPLDPVALVKRICQDAQSWTDPKTRKTRYVNRLTPITQIGRATEASVRETARKTLLPHFDLAGSQDTDGEAGKPAEEAPSGEIYSEGADIKESKPAYKVKPVGITTIMCIR